MSPLYTPTKIILSKIQQYPAVIGEPWGGGYFAGYISHTANGEPTHALIVAPRATGATGTGYTLTTSLSWKTTATTTPGATSSFDGAANTAAIVASADGIAAHPAANFCVGRSIGGFTDWYLPAYAELEIAYFNLKPTTTANQVPGGTNIYAVPRRNTGRTVAYPTQTTVTAFNTTAESFDALSGGAGEHWVSGESSAFTAPHIAFSNGFFTDSGGFKTNVRLVRAFRRIAL